MNGWSKAYSLQVSRTEILGTIRACEPKRVTVHVGSILDSLRVVFRMNTLKSISECVGDLYPSERSSVRVACTHYIGRKDVWVLVTYVSKGLLLLGDLRGGVRAWIITAFGVRM